MLFKFHFLNTTLAGDHGFPSLHACLATPHWNHQLSSITCVMNVNQTQATGTVTATAEEDTDMDTVTVTRRVNMLTRSLLLLQLLLLLATLMDIIISLMKKVTAHVMRHPSHRHRQAAQSPRYERSTLPTSSTCEVCFFTSWLTLSDLWLFASQRAFTCSQISSTKNLLIRLWVLSWSSSSLTPLGVFWLSRPWFSYKLFPLTSRLIRWRKNFYKR